MTSDAAAEDFLLTVDGVFNISGRGPVVTGRIESGVLRAGQTVEIWQGDQLVATAEADIDMVCRPGKTASDPSRIGLRLRDVDIELLADRQTIRRVVTTDLQ